MFCNIFDCGRETPYILVQTENRTLQLLASRDSQHLTAKPLGRQTFSAIIALFAELTVNLFYEKNWS